MALETQIPFWPPDQAISPVVQQKILQKYTKQQKLPNAPKSPQKSR